MLGLGERAAAEPGNGCRLVQARQIWSGPELARGEFIDENGGGPGVRRIVAIGLDLSK